MLHKLYLIALFCCLFTSCKTAIVNPQITYHKVVIDTLLQSSMSIRALDYNQSKVYYGANKNKVGYIDLITKQKFERSITKDSLRLEFRSIAVTSEAVFVLSVGNPALMYRFSKDLLSKELVYEEHHEKVFYDGLKFWNDKEGIAIGDPIDGAFSLVLTSDAGHTWKKSPVALSPKALEGEAIFAASNSNLIVKNRKAWFVTGGKSARVFSSSDGGKIWNNYTSPISQGETMTGIFTADFYDEKLGIVAGGNYDKPNQNYSNKAITNNGGKTWELIADHSAFGYASCIQFIPGSNGNSLVSVGASGLYYSNNKGTTWVPLSNDGSLYTIRFIDSTTAIAAGKNKIIRLRFE